MAAARHLVVVATTDPATTDDLADHLRDEFAVRTAYGADALLASLDDEVDVVLVGGDLDVSRGRLRERADRAGWQIGLLTGVPAGAGGASEPEDAARAADSRRRDSSFADAVVPGGVTDDEDTGSATALTEQVEWLARRARYRKRLEEFYKIAEQYAELAVEVDSGACSGGWRDRTGEPPAERGDGDEESDEQTLARLEHHLDRLRADLADTYERLDHTSVFDVALDDPPDDVN
jgi:hypothetical protein